MNYKKRGYNRLLVGEPYTSELDIVESPATKKISERIAKT